MRDRLLTSRLRASKKSVLLLGPRQVGKSTVAHSLEPDHVINLADEERFLAYSKDPGLLRRELSATSSRRTVLIDEVQRIPSLLNTVQALLDERGSKYRFILTGSSARKLRRGSVNLLPGRLIQYSLDPFLASELGNEFSLDRALQVGMLPGVYLDEREGVQILATYVDTYLREEIRAEALVQNVGSYARFLDVVAVGSGQWLNYSKLSSDAELPKETVRRFVSILEDTLIAFRLPAFQPAKKVTRRVSQRDRIFLFDVGVRNALVGLHHKSIDATSRGPLFEHWLILQVHYLNRALNKGWQLSSYRSEGGSEVDLVIRTSTSTIGIEIKSGARISERDTRGLRSLGEILPRGTHYSQYIAFTGTTRQKFESGAVGLNYLDLLRELQDLSE